MLKKPIDIVKKEKRKAFFLKEISEMIRNIAENEADLGEVFPTHVEFSQGDGMCYVYFSGLKGKESFERALEILKLYKPSIRKALASVRHARYTPDIRFMYDEVSEKTRRVDELLDVVSEEIKKSSS